MLKLGYDRGGGAVGFIVSDYTSHARDGSWVAMALMARGLGQFPAPKKHRICGVGPRTK